MVNEAGLKAVEVSGISKAYNGARVVDDISFSVGPGQIFGLIGPNGAGKTTTIRMMMDIIKPDSGEVRILGETLNEAAKDNIGYLPEERGLYRRLRVSETLVYLASLKGVPARQSARLVDELLERVSLTAHRDKKIAELSRGMGQLIQALAAIVHQPRLLILDEPFSGLDPVNTELLKEIIRELKDHGQAIILSTHQMHHVEELCDGVLMIDHGHNVLHGKLKDIKRKYRNHSVLVEYDGDLGDLGGVIGREPRGESVELFLDEKVSPRQVLEQLLRRDGEIYRFEVSTPTLNDIFIRVAGGKR